MSFGGKSSLTNNRLFLATSQRIIVDSQVSREAKCKYIKQVRLSSLSSKELVPLAQFIFQK